MSNKKSGKNGVMEWSDGINTQSNTVSNEDQNINPAVDYPVGYACIFCCLIKRVRVKSV